ncbi:hypothetical protein ASD64_07120 [Mesorhizobium sp. Root157]|uniref:hypothetical protein n=1 Tax=Mesorhizobium sp. Root157 TaxID=1736477 RepID=UPI0006FCD210|nr:hypothetical protein [Mesorhizobium sp. Root157]KQZ87205.1 hypothetical protein ASD64_07120 [Mesorhizobium sp. Root157]
MLSNERNTKSRTANRRVVPVKAATVIFAGALVVNDAGKAAPGKTAAGLVGLGRAAETVDNTSGGKSIEIDAGTFLFGNSSADPVTAASIGKDVYIVDDETVAATSDTNARSVAGICFDVDDSGVWVTFA